MRNRGVRSEVKTLIVKARKSLASSAADVLEVGVEAVRGLDRAAAKGILHPNNAARRKARLARQLAKVAKAAPAAAHAMAEPTMPSQDFFGLTVGAIGCRPNSTPAAYPPTSLHTTVATNAKTRTGPSNGVLNSRTQNPARNGT